MTDQDFFSQRFYPFTLTRDISAIRIGITTIAEKFAVYAGARKSLLYFVTDELRLSGSADLCLNNDLILRKDFQLLTAGRKSAAIPGTNAVTNEPEIFLEEGVTVENAVLNAATGPIYLSKGVTVQENSVIRGPFFAGENSVIKAGAKIYGATTIGKYCMAAGEIKNSIISDYSNKAHDGYLGDSVIGQWCNLGAGTTVSNVKNTASEVVFDLIGYPATAGLKGGLLMGDYSRAAIGTLFNTGTVIGACCNIFGSGLQGSRTSFKWGESDYILEKAFDHIDAWKRFKGEHLTDDEKKVLTIIYNHSK